MEGKNEGLTIASSASTIVSLEAVRLGKAGLDAHHQIMMIRVPNTGDWARFDHESLTLKDLAYLTAKTGDEFAILRGRHEDILFHGTATTCRFVDDLEAGLRSHRYELVGHSHPGEEEPEPSKEDRTLLKEIGQKRSSVISARTGRVTDYTSDPFEGGL